MPDVGNVSVGKPKVTGAVWKAASTIAAASIPTDAVSALASAFAELGYVSDAGVVNSNSMATQQIKAWGGDIVATPVDSHPDTFKFTLIEHLNTNAEKATYGDDNVSGSLSTGITITANSSIREEGVWVIDQELAGDVKKRIVIPKGQVTAVGDITYSDSSVIGYELTVTALPDSNGNTHYEYLKAASGSSGSSGESGESGTSL